MFIPDDANLVPVPPSNQSVPASISNSLLFELWTFPDTRTFNEPKVNLRCEFKTGKAMESAQWAGKMEGSGQVD